MANFGLSLNSMPQMGMRRQSMMPMSQMGDMSNLMAMLPMLMGSGSAGIPYEAPPQMSGVGGTSPMKKPFGGGILGRGL